MSPSLNLRWPGLCGVRWAAAVLLSRAFFLEGLAATTGERAAIEGRRGAAEDLEEQLADGDLDLDDEEDLEASEVVP